VENHIISSVLASIHYLALAVGFWGLADRTISARRLSRDSKNNPDLWAALFRGDNLWGIAALLWIASGLYRAFGGLEKAREFYLGNGFFHVKMTLFLLVFAVEIMPMVRLIGARGRRKKDPATAPLTADELKKIFRAGMIEIHLLILVIFVATLMARGVWLFS
jgi:putative membrane protein